MDPTLQSQANSEGMPLFNGPFNSPLDPNTAPPAPVFTTPPSGSPEPKSGSGDSDSARSKPLMILYVSAGIEFLVIVVLAIVLLGAHSNTPAATNTNSNSTQTTGPQPATSLGTQQASDSISQDIGNLNDDHDLPPTMLNDQALGL